MNPLEAVKIFNFLVALSNVPAGKVDPAHIQSFHDVADQIVRCYHPTATYVDSKLIENPWSKGKEWRADTSALVSIEYRGHAFQFLHTMNVAVMQRGSHIRATILEETNLIPGSKKCELRDWVAIPSDNTSKTK